VYDHRAPNVPSGRRTYRQRRIALPAPVLLHGVQNNLLGIAENLKSVEERVTECPDNVLRELLPTRY